MTASRDLSGHLLLALLYRVVPPCQDPGHETGSGMTGMELEAQHLHGNILAGTGAAGTAGTGDTGAATGAGGLRSARERGDLSTARGAPSPVPAPWWPSLPVGDGLQGPAVAAGQPERAVGQHVGAVRDAQDQQVAARRLQQGLQPRFQAAPASREPGSGTGAHAHPPATRPGG